MYEALHILGKGAGLKDVFGNPAVSARVKAAMSHLMLCMEKVVGSNAHRTVLRHINNSYKLLFGPPLVFTTPNIADTKSPVMNLLYEGRVINAWNLLDPNDAWLRLEKHSQPMPSASEMLKRVARDPVGQATLFDLMVRLFLEQVVGASVGFSSSKCADGIAANGRGGIFGAVQAYFGPIETQGRGGLHGHIHVWILQPLTGAFLAKLRSREGLEGIEPRLLQWREVVLQKVASMQFDSVEELGRQLDLPGDAKEPQRVAREYFAPTKMQEAIPPNGEPEPGADTAGRPSGSEQVA